MATGNKTTLENMASKLKAMGGVFSVSIGEPKKAMQSATVAIIPTSGYIDETTLGQPREVHIVTLRRYENMLQEPAENIEFALDKWRAEILEDVFGDFDLGGTVAYPLPTQFRWDYGYQTVENTLYRLLNLTLAYRLDDNASFVA